MKKTIKGNLIFLKAVVLVGVFSLLLMACGGGDPPNPCASGHASFTGLICDVCDNKANIGDTGPGGGIIYYRSETGFTVKMIDPTDNYTAHYLEVAPYIFLHNIYPDMDTQWCNCYPDTVGCRVSGVTNLPNIVVDTENGIPRQAILHTLGQGRRDTALILTYHAQINIFTVASHCSEYSNNDKSDWFIPSIGELYWLYQNSAAANVPTNFWLWSSSQYNNTKISVISYFTNKWHNMDKSYGCNRSPIRAF